jgi:hypothetical protein
MVTSSSLNLARAGSDGAYLGERKKLHAEAAEDRGANGEGFQGAADEEKASGRKC